MLTEKRRSQILAALRQDGLVSIQELSQRFGVSYMTIWRDLDVLIVFRPPLHIIGPVIFTDAFFRGA